MVNVRQHLGFSGTRPAAPSLLGSLLREYDPHAAKQESAVVETIMSGPLDFEEGLDAVAGRVERDSGAAAKAPAIAPPEEAEEDFSLLDLSDEELDLLIDKGAFATGEAEVATKLPDNACDEGPSILAGSAGPASGVLGTEPVKVETVAELEDAEFELIFEADDYPPELKDKPAVAPAGNPNPEFTVNLPGFEERLNGDCPGFEALPEQAGPKYGEPKDDFVIELSEDDLDSLLVELSHPPK
jgi:hypothetical protein